MLCSFPPDYSHQSFNLQWHFSRAPEARCTFKVLLQSVTMKSGTCCTHREGFSDRVPRKGQVFIKRGWMFSVTLNLSLILELFSWESQASLSLVLWECRTLFTLILLLSVLTITSVDLHDLSWNQCTLWLATWNTLHNHHTRFMLKQVYLYNSLSDMMLPTSPCQHRQTPAGHSEDTCTSLSNLRLGSYSLNASRTQVSLKE